MRLLFFGDIAATGFGTVTTDLGRALLDRGQDVRFVSQNELGDLAEPFASRTFVVNEDRAGWLEAANRGEFHVSDLLTGKAWADGWAPDAVIILGDFYAARGLVFMTEEGEAAFRQIPTYHYVPIEGIDLPASLRQLWRIATPIAMSEFGADQINVVMGTRPSVVYHGVDTDSFYPVSAARPIRLGKWTGRSKADCRKRFRIPDGYRVVLRTDKNVPRKRYPSLLRAMAPVLSERPDVVLLFHTPSAGDGEAGDLRDLRSKYPPDIQRRMCSTGFHDNGYFISRGELNALYNTADLYVSTGSEGFGLTIAEALACGVPAVGIDFSSVPEVIGPAGRTVPVWPGPAGLMDAYGQFWGAVDERKFAATVGALLDAPNERQVLGAKGPEHVRTSFSWPKAAAQVMDIVAARELVAA